MLLPDDLVTMADTGVIVIVGTRDADACRRCRAGGVSACCRSADALEICVSSRVCGRTLDNLADSNQQIAVTITSPSNCRSFQVKGRAIETRSIAPSDLERITRHQRAFTDEVVAVGMPEPSAVRLFSIEMEDAPEITNIRVLVETVFNQTAPGRVASEHDGTRPTRCGLRYRVVLRRCLAVADQHLLEGASRIRRTVDRPPRRRVARGARPFFNKTRRNILENPRAQVIVVAPETTDQYRMELEFERTETAGHCSSACA